MASRLRRTGKVDENSSLSYIKASSRVSDVQGKAHHDGPRVSVYRQASLGGGPGDMLSYWHDVLPGRVELLSIFFIVLPVSPPGLSSASMAWEGSDYVC